MDRQTQKKTFSKAGNELKKSEKWLGLKEREKAKIKWKLKERQRNWGASKAWRKKELQLARTIEYFKMVRERIIHFYLFVFYIFEYA